MDPEDPTTTFLKPRPDSVNETARNGGTKSSRQNKRAIPCCGKKCCCCTTSWKCCLITTATIVVVVVLLLVGGYFYMKSRMTGTASSKDSEMWEQRLSTNGTKRGQTNLIAGKYELVSYDKKYKEYLAAMGIPFFVIPLIMGSSETIEITEPTDDGFWTLNTATDILERSMRFRIGKEFEMIWGRNNGIMHTNCTQPEPHILRCESEERARNWNLISTSVFSQAGFINTRTFVTKGVETKKFYKRQGSQTTDEDFGKGQDLVTIAPVNKEDEESPFLEDNTDDEDMFTFDNWDVDEDDDDDWFTKR